MLPSSCQWPLKCYNRPTRSKLGSRHYEAHLHPKMERGGPPRAKAIKSPNPLEVQALASMMGFVQGEDSFGGWAAAHLLGTHLLGPRSDGDACAMGQWISVPLPALRHAQLATVPRSLQVHWAHPASDRLPRTVAPLPTPPHTHIIPRADSLP